MQIESLGTFGKMREMAKLMVRCWGEVLTLALPKKFLIITRDGSCGDRAVERFGGRRYAYYHWLNGVPFDEIEQVRQRASQGQASRVAGNRPYVVYPGRVELWKNQLFAIEVIRRVRDTYSRDVRLLCVGRRDWSAEYYEQCRRKIQECRLEDRVSFVDPLPFDQLVELYLDERCLAVMSFYFFFNLGNVVLEAFAAGQIVLGRDDESLRNLIEHGRTGLLAADEAAAARGIEELASQPEIRASMKHAIGQAAREKLVNWDERIRREIALVTEAMGISCA
jgi:glycosyltransferase involved in cell wall biosynthesis